MGSVGFLGGDERFGKCPLCGVETALRGVVEVSKDWGYVVRPLRLSCGHWADRRDRFCSTCGARIDKGEKRP